MLLNFPLQPTTQKTTYCLACHAANALEVQQTDTSKTFTCRACGATKDRALVIDPAIAWWKADDTTYWHKSVGAILVNQRGQILLFTLTKFPYGSSFPAGHLDANEDPLTAVVRETAEETNLSITQPTLLAHTDIHNDSCSRGADDHEWFLYGAYVGDQMVRLSDEGKDAVWVDLKELDRAKLPFAARYLFEKYATEISAFVQNRPRT